MVNTPVEGSNDQPTLSPHKPEYVSANAEKQKNDTNTAMAKNAAMAAKVFFIVFVSLPLLPV